MFHRQEIAINSSTGVPIPGIVVRLFDANDAPVTLYADQSSTPIETVSGIANAAVSDANGNYSYYAANGVYTERLYSGDALAYSNPDLVFQGLVNSIQSPLFDTASLILTEADANLVILSGTSAVGDGGTGRQFVYDATVDSAYVTANPATSFLDGNGRGFKEIAASSAVGLAADLASTAADKGASLVGAPKPAGALSRTLADDYNDVVKISRFHAGDGTAADTALAAAITEAQARGISRIIIPAGHYLLTDKTLPAGFTIEGEGETSRFTVGASNSNVFSPTTDDLIFRGLKLDGDSTSTSSANGNGIYTTGANLKIEDVLFDSFGHGAVRGVAASAQRGPKIIRAKVRNQGAAGHDFYLSGGWQGTLFEDLDCVNTGSADQAIGMFEETGAYWEGVEVRGGWFEGYAKWGVAVSDETWDGSDRVFGFAVHGGYWKDCTLAAIKAKLSKGVLVDGAIVDGCGGTLENGPAGLYGVILINSIGQMNVSNCILRNSSHGGIVFNGNDGPTKSYPGGYGLASIIAANNIVDSVNSPTAGYGNGIVAIGRIHNIQFLNNTVRSPVKNAFYADGANPNGIKHLLSQGNYAAHSSATDYAFHYKYTNSVRVCGDEAFDFGGIHASFDNCYSVQVDAATRYHDGRSGTALALVLNVTKFTFDGKADCSFYDAWAGTTAYAEGARVYNGSNVYECTVAGTSAGSGGPTGTNSEAEVTDGTAKWAYIHKHRQNAVGIAFSGTAPQICRIGAAADFSYVASTATTGAPSNLKRPVIASGTATLASGTASVSAFSPAEEDTGYKIALSGGAAETFSWASKSTNGFTINSSNASSSASVDWVAYR